MKLDLDTAYAYLASLADDRPACECGYPELVLSYTTRLDLAGVDFDGAGFLCVCPACGDVSGVIREQP